MVNWIPRAQNLKADEISKYVDHDDWQTTCRLFNLIDLKWGPHTIDRIANAKNTKTARFNSHYWNPAFTQNSTGETNWLVPPIYLITKAIRHARACKAAGTLIVPYWQSAPFWPLLFRSKEEFPHEFVQDSELFSDTRGLLQLGDNRNSLLGSNKFKSPLLAVQFSFSNEHF